MSEGRPSRCMCASRSCRVLPDGQVTHQRSSPTRLSPFHSTLTLTSTVGSEQTAPCVRHLCQRLSRKRPDISSAARYSAPFAGWDTSSPRDVTRMSNSVIGIFDTVAVRPLPFWSLQSLDRLGYPG